MSRPHKCRKVCSLPRNNEFTPKNRNESEEVVILKVDEYEAIRLIDNEGFSQEQCSTYMHIARTTAQLIYNTARKKIAHALVEGLPIIIDGGEYELCDGNELYCGCGGCCRHRIEVKYEKGENVVRVAVTYDNGKIFGHFGHTEQFKVYDIQDNKVISSEIVPTNGSGHGALATFLSERNVDILVCGGIGAGAQSALSEAGIKLFGGVTGDADESVNAYLAGSLNYNKDVRCNHHDNEHGDSNHTCGEHGCGGNSVKQ